MLHVFCVILVFGLNPVYCAVARAALEELPPQYAKQEGCYYKELDKFLKYGDSFTPIDGSCIKYVCGQSSTTIESCGVVVLPKGCTFLKPDMNKPYPKCCGYCFSCLATGDKVHGPGC